MSETTVSMKKSFTIKSLSNKLSFRWMGSLAVAASLALAGNGAAANFTTTTQQAAGANWSGAIWQSTTPTAGNTYECIAGGNPTRVRNPTTGGIQTFPGDSLTLDTGSEIRFK